jgi:hypothetical protein
MHFVEAYIFGQIQGKILFLVHGHEVVLLHDHELAQHSHGMFWFSPFK